MPITNEADVVLKTMHAQDGEYLYHLCEATMRGYAESIWGSWNESAAAEALAKGASDGSFSSIMVNGKRVGAVSVERHGSHHQLEQLYIEPTFQNRGIGTAVVRRIIAEAQREHRPVRLKVLTSNPARTLYERLGFAVTESSTEFHFMERRAWPQ